MNPSPNGQPIEAVASLLIEQFEIQPQKIELRAKQLGQFHFDVLTSDDRKFTLIRYNTSNKEQREAQFVLLDHLYSARKFDFILTAIRGKNGRYLQTFKEQHIALFPFVEGSPLGDPFDMLPDTDTAVASQLAHLHDALYTTSFLPADPAPFQAPTDLNKRIDFLGHAFQAHPNYYKILQSEVAIIENLAAEVSKKYTSSVLTHGNFHAASILKTNRGGYKFTNWHGFQTASAERDLAWLVHQTSMGCFEKYGRIRMPDYELDVTKLEYFYRLNRLMAIYEEYILFSVFDIAPNEKQFMYDALEKLDASPDFSRFV